MQLALNSALTLLAGCAWLLNSLHSAPDTGQSWRAVASAVLPHVERAGADRNILLFGTPEEAEEEEEDSSSSEDDGDIPRIRPRRDASTLPAAPFGLIFTRPIRLGQGHPAPRLSEDPRDLLPPGIFKKIFNASQEDIQSRLEGSAVVRPAHPDRVPNKVRRLPVYYNHGQNPEGTIFSVKQRGARIPPTLRDEGSDLEDEPLPEGPATPPADADEFTTRVWYMLLSDVTNSAPNQQGAGQPSYIRLTQGERTQVNEATYTNDKLSDYFYDCQWMQATEDMWRKNFDKLFPLKGVTREGKVQNFTRADYYKEWEKFKNNSDHVSFNLVRDALYRRSKKLYWLPKAENDRLWYTKVHKDMKNLVGDKKKAAPRVLVRGRDPI